MIKAREPYIRVRNKKNVYRFLPMHRYTAEEVKEIRKGCDMTQAVFGEMMSVSIKTLEAWEQGLNTPGSAAARLLDLLTHDYAFASEIESHPVVAYNGARVKEIRALYALPRELFAIAVGVSLNTVGSWEQDRSIPNGPASRILYLLETDPQVMKLFMEDEGRFW